MLDEKTHGCEPNADYSIPSCVSGTYFGIDGCVSCPTGCTACLFNLLNLDIVCSSCDDGFSLFGTSCSKNCPLGEFAFVDICNTCTLIGCSE